MNEGTFAQPTAWASSSGNPLDDLRSMVELMKKPPQVSPLLRVLEIPPQWLPYEAPRLERDRFSGGVNVSAQERNATLIAEARRKQSETCMVHTREGVVWCSPEVAARLRAAVADSLEVRLSPNRTSFQFPEGFTITQEQMDKTPVVDLVGAAALRMAKSAERDSNLFVKPITYRFEAV